MHLLNNIKGADDVQSYILSFLLCSDFGNCTVTVAADAIGNFQKLELSLVRI